MRRRTIHSQLATPQPEASSYTSDCMDVQTKDRLVAETKLLLEDEMTEWTAVEALWRPHADQGDLDAQYNMAEFYLDYGFDGGPAKDLEIRELLENAASRGHKDAIYRMSRRCSERLKRDALLLKAGELGSLEAQRDLGALFATGDWTGPHDSARAAEWYRLAAERGHPDAQYNLGFMYLRGEGVETDPNEGSRWLQRSAGQGAEQSLRLLAATTR